jgi:hypothetical protein
MTGQCPAVFRHVHGADRGIARPLAVPATGGPGRQALMPGRRTQRVIHFAIGCRHVTATDCDEQSVIR